MKYPSKKQIRNVGRKVYKATGLVNPYKKGKLSSTRLIKDVVMLKKLMNVEKKKFVNSNTIGVPITVGQVFGNTSGAQIVDITPTVTAGLTDQSRTGNSIKCVSFYHSFQVSQQSAANHQNMKIIVEYWLVKGTPMPANSTTMAKIFSANDFLPLNNYYVDYFSARNPDYFQNFKRLGYKTFNLQFDSTTGASGNESLARGILKRKFQHHIRYDPGSSSVINGQILMTIRADSGNRSTTTAYTDTGSVPVSAVSTGANMQFNQVWYFVDN